MSGPVRVRGSVVIPDAELSWRFSRSSGPGGQHVNTSDSAAELSFDLAGTPSLPQPYKDRALRRLAGRLIDGVITIRAEEHRSQLRNREAAKERLSGSARRGDGATAACHAGRRSRAGGSTSAAAGRQAPPRTRSSAGRSGRYDD